MSIYRMALLFIFILTSCLTISHAIFHAPGSMQEISARDVTVSQTCNDEFACRSGSFSRDSCEAAGVCSLDKDCNGRMGWPVLEYPLNDWNDTLENNGEPGCSLVLEKPHNPPPQVGFSSSSSLVVNGSAADISPCYTKRASPLNESFSLVFWLRADCSNCSVLEMPQIDGRSIFLQVVDNSLCIDSECQGILIKNQWSLITVRSVNNTLTVYNGKDHVDFANKLDELDIYNLFIGSSEVIPMGDLFELYDLRYFSDALTQREITELTSGMPDPFLEYSNCRCPGLYPEFVDSDNTNCTDGIITTPRFNTSVHYNKPAVILDGDDNTAWASSDDGPVTLAFDLGRSFEIESIVLAFTASSTLPTSIDATFVSSGRDKDTYTLTCKSSSCALTLLPLVSSDTKSVFQTRTAATLKLSLKRNGTNRESFAVSKLKITGRCDCNGNAKSCTYNQVGGYTCLCEPTTNTQGIVCGTCKLNYFMSQDDDFGCANLCACNTDGVVNTNDMCDQMTGMCKCKDKVEGSSCDSCKPFTFNLAKNDPNGCSDCNCEQSGSLSCSPSTGECLCRNNTESAQCDRCAGDSYGHNLTGGCRNCNCNTAGTVNSNVGCSDSGQCTCKENVMGLQCGKCKPGYQNLDSASVQGCEACSCHPVGVESSLCDSISGRCQCRDGVITDQSCTPVVLSIEPTFGPEIGGTFVTINGHLLGNGSHTISAYIGNHAQEIISENDNTVVIKTSQYNSSINKSPTNELRLSWVGVSNSLNTGTTFDYLPNPIMDASRNSKLTTYVNTGCPIKFYGLNLDSVKHPRLLAFNSAKPGLVAQDACVHRDDYIYCIAPTLKSLTDNTKKDNFNMELHLDGFVQSIDLVVLESFGVDDVNNIKFQYPFETSVDLSGHNLKSSCQVSVHIGVISCEIKHLSNDDIEFVPPKSAPGGYMKQEIQVTIGSEKLFPGTLQYLELYETTVFIIIVSCIGGAILLAIIVVIVCCCCRRRNHAPSPTSKLMTEPDGKPVVEVDNRHMNNYSELITLVDAPVLPPTTNGHGSPVHVETVVLEHKKGIVNTEAETNILAEEFLPRIEFTIRDDVKKCYVGSGHFVTGRTCLLKGRHTQLVDGSLLKNGVLFQKLTIKSVTDTFSGHQLPTWANVALSESLRLRKFKHNHILSIVGIGSNQHQFHILYPFMAKGLLKALVSDTNKDFSVRELLGFCQQVAEAIDFLASKDVTHKDVAARNCMVDEYSVVKLGDAAFSWDFYSDEYVFDKSRDRYLPIRWMAPESLQDGYYDMRTDVWSFAVLVWELLTRGCLPFHEVTDSSNVTEYILQGYILGRPETLSADIYELMRSCWSIENESRPSIASVARTLSEIIEGDNDETYENPSDVSTFQQQRNGGLAASPRYHNSGNGIPYSTTGLSKF